MLIRFQQKRYTESDVRSLYIDFREKEVHPFVREVGDFIAHSHRDKGATLDQTAYMFSQLAFFQKYQGTGAVALSCHGECGWWLKCWLLGKVEDEPMSILKRISGLGKKDLRKKIASWFPERQAYPTTISCDSPVLFYALANQFSSKIRGKSVFEPKAARTGVRKLLQAAGISKEEIEPVLVATGVILNGRSIEIVPGFTATVKLTVDPQRSERLYDREIPPGANWHYARSLPDGNLKVSVSTENRTGDGFASVGLDLIDTNIDTEKYFCRNLITTNQHGFPTLDLVSALVFERSSSPMVFRE